jgi:sec-independent protein translocase protein TatA
MPIQWWELVLILLVVLLLFGAKRVPEMGRSLGKGMREFKDAVSGNERPATSPPAELPSAEDDEVEVEETERETVR